MSCHRIRNNTYTLAVCLSLAIAARAYPAWAQDTAVTQEKAKQEKAVKVKGTEKTREAAKADKATKSKEAAKTKKAEKAMSEEENAADRADPCRVEPDLPGCAKATNKNK